MAGAFVYDFANRKITVTGGTSGAPADFAALIAADRAGTLSLLPAIAPALGLTLTTQIRPCEKRALPLSITLAGTNAGAGDSVILSGTDAWGQVQTESIDVSGGNGAYISAKRFQAITSIDCSGFDDEVGAISITQPQWGVIWDKGNNQYEIWARLYFGDGVTPTYFKDYGKHIVFPANIGWVNQDCRLTIRNNAIAEFGVLNDISKKITNAGCHFLDLEINTPVQPFQVQSGGVLYFYSSTFKICYGGGLSGPNNTEFTFSGTGRIWDSSLQGGSLNLANPDIDIYNISVEQGSWLLNVTGGGKAHKIYGRSNETGSLVMYYGGVGEVWDSDLSSTGFFLYSFTGDLYLINTTLAGWNIVSAGLTPTGTVWRQYTFDLQLSDFLNNPIVGATATLRDKDGNIVFIAVTGADGKIVQKRVTRAKATYVDGSWVWTTYTPHTLTLSKTGMQTYRSTIDLDSPKSLVLGLWDGGGFMAG